MIGFIGQGFIGKAYADNFKQRGHMVHTVDEHSSSDQWDRIRECEIVFVAVPAPTKPDRSVDFRVIMECLAKLDDHQIAVIKSTIPPGTTHDLQVIFPKLWVMHAPEFLRAATAGSDVETPERNIVGYSQRVGCQARAYDVLMELPHAPINMTCTAESAEMTKYASNVFLTMKVIYSNIIWDLARSVGADPEFVLTMMGADKRIGHSHTTVWNDGRRGADGYCFPKDLSAFIGMLPKGKSRDIFDAMEYLNETYLKHAYPGEADERKTG